MELVKRFNLTQEDALLIIDATARGIVNLLLGAGASYGATGGDGAKLKGGVDLAEELNENFRLRLDKPDSSNLPLVYSDIESSVESKAPLNFFLAKRFTHCRPTWQSILFEFPWKRIWTLNIDDVLDHSMSAQGQKKTENYLWCENFSPRPLGNAKTQIIYLHGKASALKERPDHLIFSLKEYASHNENTPGWHTEFRSEWIHKPFIVCGARLQDEFDLATVIEFGNRSRERGGCPSIIVLREFAAGQAARFSRQGLIPVATTGEDFFDALKVDLLAWNAKQAKENPALKAAKEEVRYAFRSLTIETLPPRKILDFYASAETQWSHIVQNLDSPFRGTTEAVDWLLGQSSPGAKLALFYGESVSGKTAAALRASAELLNKNFEVWFFRAEERFKETAIIEYSKYKKAVFVFDDCADFSSSLQEMIKLANENNCNVRIIVTCDSHRLRAVRADVRSGIRIEVPLEPLERNDFVSIFEKRSSKGRLGRRSTMSLNSAWKEFKREYNGQLLEWLESLENAYSYRSAIAKMLGNPATSNDLKLLIQAVSAVHRFGYSLPFIVANDLVDKGALEEAFSEESQLGQIGYLDEHGVRLRSTAFSQFVWSLVDSQSKYKITLTIVSALSPLVVPQSIARRSLPYLIVKSLMDHDVVKSDLGDRSETWYSRLESANGWNARFWEQRALLASNNNQEDLAYSYAKKAVAILEQDAFPHTTLGKVCVKIGVARKDEVGVNRFWEGVEELKRSRILSVEKGLEWEHPYITFFTYALRAATAPHFKDELVRISISWKEWMRAAQESETLTFDEEGKSQLDGFNRKWLLTAVKF